MEEENQNQEQIDELVLEENMKGIEKVLHHKKEMPAEENSKIQKKIFVNILIADVIMLFLYFICLGSFNIEPNVFMTDLKVFSIGIAIFSVLLFEISYRKDSGALCIHGIEVLLLAMSVLGFCYMYQMHYPQFHRIVALVSFLFAIYYVGKAIAINQRMKKKYYASVNDINEIIKK